MPASAKPAHKISRSPTKRAGRPVKEPISKAISDLPQFESVSVDRLFLDTENPRHPAVDTEIKAIEKLCKAEQIYPLANDIAKHGLSPLERFALVPSNSGSAKGRRSYLVVEGNRRICAIKLLNDPDLAPADQRKQFEKLAESWSPIEEVSAVIFADKDDVSLWLDRIHSGQQGGIGRKEWNADQKSRFNGENKNRFAQSILDYGQREGFISELERVGKLTTVHRFISNDVFREVLGADNSDPNEIGRNRPKPEFDLILKRFLRDLIKGDDVSSRMNKTQIIDYARTLPTMPGISHKRIDAESLAVSSPRPIRPQRSSPPKAPAKITHIEHQKEIADRLKALGNQKLSSLYYSICDVDLDPHAPLVSVGVWSFIETLTVCSGRSSSTDFVAYFSKNKLISYGLPKDNQDYRAALERIQQFGNATKHHPIAGTFHGPQLNNDVTLLKDVILKCIEEAFLRSTTGAKEKPDQL